MQKKTLGGERLGAGKRMKVDLHGYERSTHDLGYLWRSTMSAGTLVPFMSEVALPGDTFDIDLDLDLKTHPTVGPLFGSYKAQLDVFQCPMRLYHGKLHNNALGIGMNMASIQLPVIALLVDANQVLAGENIDTAQINPSCILSYLGIRGIGVPHVDSTGVQTRTFNALPYLGYVDIYKNYYANKQEEIGVVITQEYPTSDAIDTIKSLSLGTGIDQEWPSTGGIATPRIVMYGDLITVSFSGGQPNLMGVSVTTDKGKFILGDAVILVEEDGTSPNTYIWKLGKTIIYNWELAIPNEDGLVRSPKLKEFDLADIDKMREEILKFNYNAGFPFNVTLAAQITPPGPIEPYRTLLTWVDGNAYMGTQEGLLVKTYNSDLFNNWLSTEWLDGPNGINEITAIDTSGGSINIDTILLSKKVYDMLNRIAISGGTYNDWVETVYDQHRYTNAETPIYHGGLIRELVFQEVVSNSSSGDAAGTDTDQPLGTLAGKGVMAQKRKGGHVTIRVDEPSYIIGIISLTPRIDYSQGNKWDVHLKTMDDLHKPGLDEIGFQDLIMEQMAWWSTEEESVDSNTWIQKSAGKQPAWINYMTNVNRTYGNFAVADNEMFMTLNRRYEKNPTEADILDMTTYIDPTKFNYSFAETALDAQNFWAQIAVDITARRKMSAKIMPNL